MCYKVATPQEAKLREFLAPLGFEVASYQHYFHADGFTMPYLPITATDAPKKVEPAMWKLIPHWVKTEADAKKYANTLNATCEDIFEKTSYKSYIGKNRALLWVDGFFEPNHPDPYTTIPYYIKSVDNNPFSLGCVFSNWLNHDTGEIIKTFGIITTPANLLLRKIHDKMRMPLVIPADQRNKWLSPLNKSEIAEMMQPLPEGILQGYRVSNLVYKKGVNSNVPEVILPQVL